MHIAISKMQHAHPSGFSIMLYQKYEGVGDPLFGKEDNVPLEDARAMILMVLVEKLDHDENTIVVDGAHFDFGAGVSLIEVSETKYSIREIKDSLSYWLSALTEPGAPKEIVKPYQPGVRSRRG